MSKTQSQPKRVLETDDELLELCKDMDEQVVIEIKRLSHSGDDTERLAWDPRNLEEMKEARDKFYELLDKGYRAFAVDMQTGEAKTNRKLIQFDPNAGEIIFTFKEAVQHARKGRKTVAQPAVVGG